MKKIKTLLFALLLALAPSVVMAQALTPACSNPPPNYGVVWTSGQWISCLSSFQAYLGYTPLNVAGGAMSGELYLQTSVTTNAPLNFPPGLAPTSPVNGDFWFTSAGAFYRAGGVTIGPLASASGGTFANPTFTGTVTFPDLSTWTSAGAQGLAHLYVARTTDAGGGQPFQVQGGGYFSGNIASATSTTTGFAGIGGATGSQALAITQPNGTRSGLSITQTGIVAWNIGLASSSNELRWDPTSSNFSTPAMALTSAGVIKVTGINTNSGIMSIGSAGGGTVLSDVAVQLSNAAYHTCSLLGTNSSGTITCGGAPSGYITWNDNVTTNTTAVSGNLYCMNTNAGALTLTAPASPGNGNYFAFVDCGGNFGNHNLTVAGNGANIMYNSGNMTVANVYAGGVFRYSSGSSSWILSPL